MNSSHGSCAGPPPKKQAEPQGSRYRATPRTDLISDPSFNRVQCAREREPMKITVNPESHSPEKHAYLLKKMAEAGRAMRPMNASVNSGVPVPCECGGVPVLLFYPVREGEHIKRMQYICVGCGRSSKYEPSYCHGNSLCSWWHAARGEDVKRQSEPSVETEEHNEDDFAGCGFLVGIVIFLAATFAIAVYLAS